MRYVLQDLPSLISLVLQLLPSHVVVLFGWLLVTLHVSEGFVLTIGRENTITTGPILDRGSKTEIQRPHPMFRNCPSRRRYRGLIRGINPPSDEICSRSDGLLHRLRGHARMGWNSHLIVSTGMHHNTTPNNPIHNTIQRYGVGRKTGERYGRQEVMRFFLLGFAGWEGTRRFMFGRDRKEGRKSRLRYQGIYDLHYKRSRYTPTSAYTFLPSLFPKLK